MKHALNRFKNRNILILALISLSISLPIIFFIISNGLKGRAAAGTDPVAYWKFDDASGTSAQDSSANNNDGTLGSGSSAPTWMTEDQCMNEKCLLFDGTTDYVSVSAHSSINFSEGEDLTVSAWIKRTTTGVNTYIINKQENVTNEFSYTLNINSSNKAEFSVSKQNVAAAISTGTTTLAANKWYLLTGVYDGNTVSIYVDSQLEDSSSETFSGSTQSIAPLQIGKAYNNTFFYEGFIDEVKIYDYARSAAEIKSDYVRGASGAGSKAVLGDQDLSFLSNGLVGYWKMDEVGVSGTSWTAADSSGNGNNGTGAGNASVGTTASGKFGNGGFFDGNGDYITSTTYKSSLNPNYITMAAWFKADTTSTERWIMGLNGAPVYFLRVYNNELQCLARTSGGPNQPGISFTDTTGWNHAVCTWDGSSARLYLNGELVSTVDTYPGTLSVSASHPFYIGTRQGTGQYWDGQIDEARVYNRALDASEVKALYEWAPGPVGYWNLDEGVGSTANDTSGNNHTGSLGSGTSAPAWVTGKVGNGLSFDGTNDTVSIPDNNSLEFGNSEDFTVTLWFKASSSGNTTDRTMVEKWDQTGGYPYVVRILGASTNKVYVARYDGTNNPQIHSTETYNDDRWHHVGFTKSGSTLTLYIDGKLDGTTTDNTTGTTTNSASVTFGSRSSILNTFFKGAIDDVKIYNYARTQKQIVEDMNGGHPAPGSPVGSAALHLSFDEGYGATANDRSINRFNGTLGSGTSAPSWTNDGKFGKALTFDGTNDYVSISDSDAIDYTASQDFTMSVWVKIPTAQGDLSGTQNSIIEKWNTTGGFPYNLRYNNPGSPNNGKVSVGRYDGTNAPGIISLTSLNDNRWHHHVLTKNGSILSYYIDGKLQGTDTDTTTGTTTNSASLYIGARSNNTRFFSGSVDELKLYAGGMTASQVLLEYNQGKALVLGSASTTSDGTSPSFAASREYCIPGDTASCNPPVVHFKLDESSGNVAYSVGVTASAVGTVSWETGKYGSSVNTTNGYLSAGDPADGSLDFDADDDFTYQAWVKTTNNGTSSVFLYKNYGGGTPGWRVRKSTANTPVCEISDSNSGTDTVGDSTTSLNDGMWHHIACVVVQSTPTKYLYIYVDGRLKNSTTHTRGSHVNSEDFRVGGSWPGSVDDVRVYNYARTAAQIGWDYNRGAPIGWYRFDECTGDIAYNAAKNANGQAMGMNGTITIGASGSQTSSGTCSSGNSAHAWNNGTTGKRNASLKFDGTDDYVRVNDSDALDFGSSIPFTVSFWTKMTGSGRRNQDFIDKRSGTGFKIEYQNSLQALQAYISDGLGGFCTIRGTKDIEDNQWHHITVVFKRNPSCTTNDILIYIDGKRESTTLGSSSNNTNVDITNTAPLDISDPSDYVQGFIDDVRIYNTALTSKQIIDAMNGGAVRY